MVSRNSVWLLLTTHLVLPSVVTISSIPTKFLVVHQQTSLYKRRPASYTSLHLTLIRQVPVELAGHSKIDPNIQTMKGLSCQLNQQCRDHELGGGGGQDPTTYKNAFFSDNDMQLLLFLSRKSTPLYSATVSPSEVRKQISTGNSHLQVAMAQSPRMLRHG